MALAALQPSYGIRPGTYGSLGPMLNPDGSYRRVPLGTGASPDSAAGVMAPGATGDPATTNYNTLWGQVSAPTATDAGLAAWNADNHYQGDDPMQAYRDSLVSAAYSPAQLASLEDYNQKVGTGAGNSWANFGRPAVETVAPFALGANYAAGGFGDAASGATPATGIGEGSASTAATGVTPAATTGIGAGAGTGSAAAGGLDEAAMIQAARTASLDSLASQGITTGAAGAGAGAASAGTAMSRILDGTATTADWLSVGGNLAGTGLGIAGARNQANAFNNLAGQYMAFGAPSRSRYEASMTPGFDPNSIPGYSGAVDTASKGILARLSATGGNPYGNPGGLIEANKQIISGTALPAIQDYQRLNAGTGGYAGFNAAAPGAATAGIGAQGGVYNAIGSGLAGLTNPQPSIYDTLARLGVQGLS